LVAPVMMPERFGHWTGIGSRVGIQWCIIRC
jgi:hypothetical protein